MTLMLEGAVDDRDLMISGLKEQLRQAQEALAIERSRNAQTDKGMKQLRSILAPLHGALGAVFGELDAMGIGSDASQGNFTPAPDARKAAIWESWKKKFPGTPARFIEALLLHGELTQTQLRIHAQCAQGSVAGVVSTLWKAGLISKNGGKISLKDV